MERVIILDRDGVINHDSPSFIKSLAEWQPIDGSLEAIARLSRAGWRVIVCTNQSGVARGLVAPRDLEVIHRQMQVRVEQLGGRIDGIYHCPHGPSDHCDCRKPAPGLLLQAAADFGFDLAGIPVVGDAPRDLEAARRVDARPILVLTGKGRETEQQDAAGNLETYVDLRHVVQALMAEEGAARNGP